MKNIKETLLGDIPLLVFDSTKWESNDEYKGVSEKIISLMKKKSYDKIFIQNAGYEFGNAMAVPLFIINSSDFGGFEGGTLDLFIQDLVYDLIPE